MNIYIAANKRFGAYKINNKLREQGFKLSIGKLYRLLSTMNLPTVFTKKPVLTYVKAKSDLECPNLLKQSFHAQAPNTVWISDITYVKVTVNLPTYVLS